MAHPDSSWRSSLLANIGVVEARSHAYTRAFDALERAWLLAKDATEPRAKAVADFAVAEWLELAVSFGQLEAVDSRLREIQSRPIGGSAGVKIARARENLGLIKTYPHLSRWCGPEALMALIGARSSNGKPPRVLTEYKGSADGMTLAELEALARSAGLRMRSVRRSRGDIVPVPSIAHLRVNHYVTVVESKAGRYRVIDRTRGQEYWIDAPLLVAETSGYFLVAEGH